MVKITKDQFLWLVLDVKSARALYNYGTKPVYKLYPDDSEAMIEDNDEIVELDDILYGVEIGFLNNLKKIADL